MKSSQKEETIEASVAALKQKMKTLNFSNMQPPYLPHSLTKFRFNYTMHLLKNSSLANSQEEKKLKPELQTIRYIIENFDDDCFDTYAEQMRGPYIRKIFQENYQLDAVNFVQANRSYHLKTQIEQTLTQAAEWLIQIQITQDLLSRVELYFKLNIPTIIEKIKHQGINETNTWAGSFASCFKKIVSFSLRKSSKTIQSTMFATLAPTALMLTLAIIGGTTTLPWKPDLSVTSIMPAVGAIAIPYILDGMAETVEKSELEATLQRWALTFERLSESIRKFNEIIELGIKNCAMASDFEELQKQKTNLQKIINCLSKDINVVSNYKEQEFEEMRERTEAYFKQYVEIKDQEWTIVYPKEEESDYK